MQRAQQDVNSISGDERQQLESAIGTKATGEMLMGKQSVLQFKGVSSQLRGNAAIRNAAIRKENNTGLPNNLKIGIENLSGIAMDDVKVHYNSSKPRELRALAYTQGTDIHVAPGQEKHLPHEAWHVVQQKQGRVKPTLQMKGARINDDGSLEREADVMGSTAMLMMSNSAQTPMSKEGKLLNPHQSKSHIQRVAQPGVGVELETQNIWLRYDDKEHFDSNTFEPIEDKPLPDRLKAPALKGQKIAESPNNNWSITAETTQYKNHRFRKELNVEIIVHGTENKGVKLNNRNEGILEEIGTNILDFLTQWIKQKNKTVELGGVEWKIDDRKSINYAQWALQITAPVPLGAFHDLLEGGLAGTPSETLLGRRQANLSKMKKVDEGHIPEKFQLELEQLELRDIKPLLGLLSLIASYTHAGTKQSGGGLEGVKKWIPVMPRTNFVGMFKLLDQEIQTYLLQGNNWYELVEQVNKAAKINNPQQATFIWGENNKLTYNEWIENIPLGQDLMSTYDKTYRLGQIGGLGENTEHLINNNNEEAPIFEFRDTGSIYTKDIPTKMIEIEAAIRALLTE